MFDQYVLKPGDAHHTHTHNVTEKRAPTDESVRLLKEMEQAARDSITDSIRVMNTPVDCVIHREEDYINSRVLFGIHMKINGCDIQHKIYIDNVISREKAIELIVDSVGARIAAEALAIGFREAFGKFHKFP